MLRLYTSIDPFDGYANRPNTLNDYIYAGGNPVRYVDLSGKFFSMSSFTLGGTLSSMNTLSNIYTVAPIGVDIAGGNYTGAAKDIVDEVVGSKLGRIRAVGNLGNRGLAMFSRLFTKGRLPALTFDGIHSSNTLRKNMNALGIMGNRSNSRAHHIIGSGKDSEDSKKYYWLQELI